MKPLYPWKKRLELARLGWLTELAMYHDAPDGPASASCSFRAVARDPSGSPLDVVDQFPFNVSDDDVETLVCQSMDRVLSSCRKIECLPPGKFAETEPIPHHAETGARRTPHNHVSCFVDAITNGFDVRDGLTPFFGDRGDGIEPTQRRWGYFFHFSTNQVAGIPLRNRPERIGFETLDETIIASSMRQVQAAMNERMLMYGAGGSRRGKTPNGLPPGMHFDDGKDGAR